VKLLRIGLTLRRTYAEGYDESRDALACDWVTYFQGPFRGAMPCPILNAGAMAVEWAENLALDGLILTGGGDPGDDPLRHNTEVELLSWAETMDVPVLGICRGFQVMHRQLGGALVAVSGHVGSKHTVDIDGESREVNSFHGKGIQNLAAGFELLAQAEDGTVECALDQQRRWLGMMWHPEREAHPNLADTALIRKHFGLPEIRDVNS